MDTVNKLRKEFREEQPKMPSGAIVPYEKWMEKKLMDTEKKVEALEDRAEGLQSKSNIFEGMYHTKVKKVEELAKYAQHRPICNKLQAENYMKNVKCTCGLNEALKE